MKPRHRQPGDAGPLGIDRFRDRYGRRSGLAVAGDGKEKHATRERMDALGKAFPGINYRGFAPQTTRRVSWLPGADGRDQVATSELDFGYLLIGPDGGTPQRLRAARLVNGWRITQD